MSDFFRIENNIVNKNHLAYVRYDEKEKGLMLFFSNINETDDSLLAVYYESIEKTREAFNRIMNELGMDLRDRI